MSRPRLLDLFCCQGGAAMGYHRAGFDVVGVDIVPQPRYPFEFVQADALEYVAEHGAEFDAIHASPPCQAYSVTRFSHSKAYPKLIGQTRDLLRALGKPYVIENVQGARNQMEDPIMLCGSMFDLVAIDDDGEPLALRRHRLFESNQPLAAPSGCRHTDMQVGGVYGGGPMQRNKNDRRGGYTPATHVRADLMGIHWATRKGLSEAIPPAYTEWIGKQLIESVVEVAA